MFPVLNQIWIVYFCYNNNVTWRSHNEAPNKEGNQVAVQSVIIKVSALCFQFKNNQTKNHGFQSNYLKTSTRHFKCEFITSRRWMKPAGPIESTMAVCRPLLADYQTAGVSMFLTDVGFLLRRSPRTRSCWSGTETPTTPSWEFLESPEETRSRARRARTVTSLIQTRLSTLMRFWQPQYYLFTPSHRS